MTGTGNLQMQYVEEQYEMLTSLGKDGGETFLVKEKRSGKIFVKKYVSSDAALLYKKLRGIQNRHLTTIYEVVSDKEKGIIIEEYISGRTLKEYIEERGALTPDETVRIIGELCEVLDTVHKLGMIHRDVTPDNIILSLDGVVKLIDFGIARNVKEDQNRDTAILGTVGYAAPEQFGFRQSDERTDIYALGILMKEMLTGTPAGQQYEEGMVPFANIIKKCTEIDPEKRFQTISQLEKALGIADGNIVGNGIKNISRKKGSCVRWLPGFRTGILWKNMIASFGYGLMFFATYLSLESFKGTLEITLLESLAVFLYVWMSVLVIVNVADWDKKLPLFRKLPGMLRVVIRFILGMIIFERGIAIENYVKSLVENLPVS